MSTPLESRMTLPRERIYVDFRIQMRMLIALLIMETLLTGGGIVYLYFRFKSVIEENLYRIHQTKQDIFSLLVEETGWVIGIMLVINIVGLLVADRLWVWYVQKILATFTSLATRVTDLDFRLDGESSDQHLVLDLMLSWRQKERSRAQVVRTILDQLDGGNPAAMKIALRELRTHLPPYSRRFVGRLRPDRPK